MILNLKRLKAERIACGITQDEMAYRMGWKTRTPYAKRENGLVDIGANEFIKMAKILGYETNNLDIFLLKMFPMKNVFRLKKGGQTMKENQEYMNDAEWRIYGLKSDYEKVMKAAKEENTQRTFEMHDKILKEMKKKNLRIEKHTQSFN